jgi:NADPH:quinone reductase
MRALVCKAFDGIDALTVEEAPPPPMQPGGVRIRVRAAALNFADTLMAKGDYQVKPPLPFAPGLEAAGEVLEVAPDVRRVKPGDRVMAVCHYGAFAEEAVTSGDAVWKVPDNLSDTEAAAFPIVYGTAHVGLTDKLDVKPGDWVMVHGAAGGAGLAAVEVAKLLGCRVIATAGGREKLDVALRHGADAGIDYRAESIKERAKQITDGVGVDAVFDPVGGDAFDQSLRAVRQGGRILVVGFASGTVPQIPANILLVKNVSAMGFYWGAYRTLAPEVMEASFRTLLDWAAGGKLHPHVSHTFPLEQAGDAFAALLGRRSTGKVVLSLDG